mgnify:CR=1
MATVGWIFIALGSAGLLVPILCAILCEEPKATPKKGE